jgi:ankyrin repeat protein
MMAVDQASGGSTALHHAAWRGHADVVKLLLQAGADVNAKTRSNSETPLHLAAMHGHTDVIQLLLQAGADVNARTADDS